MDPRGGIRGTIARAWRWLKSRIGQPVAAQLAECEFHCDRPDCREGEWEQCENRLAHEAWAREHASRP